MFICYLCAIIIKQKNNFFPRKFLEFKGLLKSKKFRGILTFQQLF